MSSEVCNKRNFSKSSISSKHINTQLVVTVFVKRRDMLISVAMWVSATDLSEAYFGIIF